METVKECIDRMIEPGQIMTIGRGSTKFVEVVNTQRVPLTRNSIAVKERGDNYVFYISVDSLYFDNHYCGNCNGEGIEPKSVHYSKPFNEEKLISDSLDKSWENGRQYGITEAHLIVLNIANENPAISFNEFLKEFAKRLQEK